MRTKQQLEMLATIPEPSLNEELTITRAELKLLTQQFSFAEFWFGIAVALLGVAMLFGIFHEASR